MAKANAEKIKVQMYASVSGSCKRTKNGVKALGFKKIGDERELPKNDAVLGAVRKYSHILRVANQ